MKKFIATVLLCVVTITLLSSCEMMIDGASKDIAKTQGVADKLQAGQATPTDIEYSLERYNLIRRAYWVNGQRDKANALICEVVKPLGYIVLVTGNVIVGSFTVDGKISSLNSYLTPDSEYYEKGGASSTNEWLADVDGTYGNNDDGIFFFTTDGKYIEWSGTYLYSDIPFNIDNPIIVYEVSNK